MKRLLACIAVVTGFFTVGVSSPAWAQSNVWRYNCSAGSPWAYRGQWTATAGDGLVTAYSSTGVYQASASGAGTWYYYVPSGGQQPSYTKNAAGTKKNFSSQGTYPCI